MQKFARFSHLAFGLALSLCLLGQGALALETTTTSESKDVKVTIYNQNLGVVKDTREVEFKEGLNYLSFEDVANLIEPTSVKVRCLSAPSDIVIREQNFRYDLLEPSMVLYKSIGKNAEFTQTLPNGQVERLAGKILFSPLPPNTGGLVIQSGDKVILNPQGQVEMTELPADMFSKPSLLWTIAAKKGGRQLCEVSYETGGMDWHADYVLTVDDNDDKADLNSWVTLNNQSGATFKQAGVKLLAGDVNVDAFRQLNNGLQEEAKPVLLGAMGSGLTEHGLSEYHIYTLNGKTDILNKETKQLSLFQAFGVPVKKQFVFEWYQNLISPTNYINAQAKIEFENKKENGLGMPIPAGNIRVMKADRGGSLEFIGSDTIRHTSKDEKISVVFGSAFDLVGEQKQLTDEHTGRNRKTNYQVVLRNHKDADVTCTVIEHALGDWKINAHSMPLTKTSSDTFQFIVPIKANSSATITFELETRA